MINRSNITNHNRAIKNFDPRENLQKEYEDKLVSSYNYWIVVALTQGEQDVVFQFLKRVPNTAKKGHYLDIFCGKIYFLYLQ